MIILAILPVAILVVSVIFWFLYMLIGRTKTFPVGRMVSSIVVMLFMVHPNIVSYTFLDFKCVDIDGDNRLLADLDVICWSSAHSSMTFFVAIPSIIVWGLGIPFFMFIFLIRSKKSLDIIDIREKWGFLFGGFKKDFYYWEILIMYRKVLIIFISVYVTAFGVIAQALILLLVLILFTLLTVRKRPYSKPVF
jgi:hypothetical protein